VQRRAGDLHQTVDRHRLRMFGQIRERLQQPGAFVAGFAETDDAATAGLQSGRAHVGEGVESILEVARVDDLAVMLGRGIEIVVVVGQPRRLQRLCLAGAEHAERRAGFQAQRVDRAHHVGDLLDVAILRRAPGRAHAEATRAGLLGRARLGQYFLGAHQLVRLEPGVVARRLRAVGAIFGAAAGLDREQGRDLHLVRIEMFAMHLRRAEQQVVERQVEQRAHFGARPVVAKDG
jgi:hypothetical protein